MCIYIYKGESLINIDQRLSETLLSLYTIHVYIYVRDMYKGESHVYIFCKGESLINIDHRL